MYVGGKLHVQLHYDDILYTDNHGWLFLQDASGEQIDPLWSECFWDEAQTGSYQEYVFDCDDASECQLYGAFTTCNTRIPGRWEITFPIKGTANYSARAELQGIFSSGETKAAENP